jgi:hypothetical protein
MPSNESEFIKRIVKIEKWLRRLETLITRPAVSSSTGTTHDEVTVVDTATINLTLVGQQLQADAIGGGSAHVIKDEGGAGLTARANLNFAGAGVTATDNAGTNATDVTIPGSIAVANIGSTAETVGGAVANGSAATASRSDHKHAITNPKLDDLATPDNNTDLNSNTTNHGLLLTAVAPAATLLNVPGIANGETAYTLKPMFDATHPEDLGVAAEGSQVIAARRDHVHTLPKLDDLNTPDVNTDLNANTTNHGLLLQATAPAAGLMNFVGLTNGETAYLNKPLFDTTNPEANGVAAPGTQVIAARRDHVHAGGAGDVATDTIWDAKGDLAVGTGANAAAKLTVGADGRYLKAASGEATGLIWDSPAGSGDVVGPAGATDGNLALFDGATGKLIKDGGAPGAGSTDILMVQIFS